MMRPSQSTPAPWLRRGVVQPAVVLEGIESTIAHHLVDDPVRSSLYQPFERFPGDIPATHRSRLRAAGQEAILASVVPGYREFLRFMVDEYKPGARQEIGASALPEGPAFYRHRLRSFTTRELSPEAVHDIGREEVARIRAEMEACIAGIGFDGTFEEFVHFLRTDERFHADSAEALLREIAYVLKRMDGEFPRLFSHLPRMPYGIREIPAYIAPRSTAAYYQRPAGEGSRAGFYWVNAYELPSRPLHELETLSFHEAVPGHHLQIALKQELAEPPAFRRFAVVTAFSEGWALYAERLGRELGFFTNPYSDFGRLAYEMLRACRLVVDTGTIGSAGRASKRSTTWPITRG